MNEKAKTIATKKKKTKTEVAYQCSKAALSVYGIQEPTHSVSGNVLYFPPKVQNADHYTFIRLVGPSKEKSNVPFKSADAKKFYCILCSNEYGFCSGSSNQIICHNTSPDHLEKKASSELKKQVP